MKGGFGRRADFEAGVVSAKRPKPPAGAVSARGGVGLLVCCSAMVPMRLSRAPIIWSMRLSRPAVPDVGRSDMAGLRGGEEGSRFESGVSGDRYSEPESLELLPNLAILTG